MTLDKERRQHKRFKYEAPISHDVPIDDVIHSAKMFNFSKGGLYFESEQIIHPGEDIFVGLAMHTGSAGEDSQLLFEVKILWREEIDNSHQLYGYGGKFLHSHESFPDTGPTAGFETQAAPVGDFRGENDARKYSRKSLTKNLRLLYNKAEYKGVVVNIGRGGAYILTEGKFALGGRIKLAGPSGKTRKEFKVNSWIVRISPEGIGVSFERRSGRERRSDLDRRTGLERRGLKSRKNRSS